MSRGLRLVLHKFSLGIAIPLQAIHRCVAVVCLALLISRGANAQMCTQWTEAARSGQLESQLTEASGVAVSRRFPGRMYHINDSGDEGKFYITDMEGKGTRGVRIAGFDPVDTEALGLGPCPSKSGSSCLYVGDIGDNNAKRKSIEIAIVDETQNFNNTVKPRALLKLHYPDKSHDAESLAIQPNGVIFILTKERPAHLFSARADVPEQTLVPVTTLDPGNRPTDLAVSDDGQRLLVLTYMDAVEYSIDFKQQRKIPLNFLQQQESVTYLPGSRSFIYTTEQALPGLPQWIMKVDCMGPK